LIVLDTNVVSEGFRPRPDPRAAAVVARWPIAELYLTAVSVGEIRSGIARMPDGQRKLTLFEATERIIRQRFDGRILSFSVNSSAHYADLVADRFGAGRPIAVADGQIAAICRQHGATLLTRNVRDFEGTGIEIIDPWAG